MLKKLKAGYLKATKGGVLPRKKDYLGGCDVDFSDDMLEADVDMFCLFADVDLNNYAEVENRKSDIEALAALPSDQSSLHEGNWA